MEEYLSVQNARDHFDEIEGKEEIRILTPN
jgi:hypothetical protein